MKRAIKRIAPLLLLASLFSAPGPQTGGFGLGGNPRPNGGFAFFEFAPANGAGLTNGACAGQQVTGAKGEALTFARASTAMCVKGNPTTGIQNGDLVLMPAGAPRVGNPDGQGLALLVESSRQNTLLRSEQFNNASWAYSFSAGKSATVTADQAVAPDGTLTADRLVVPATTGAEYSLRSQTGACAVSADAASVYVKGNGTSGTITMITYLPVKCTTCSYNPTTWTRCTDTNTISSGGTFGIGNDSVDCGGSPGAQDVFIWGAQCEAGTYATSYIPTVAAAVTRAAEPPPTLAVAATGPDFSLAATAWWPSSSVGAVSVVSLGTAAPNLATIGRSTNTAASFLINATTTTPAVSAMGTTAQRGALADAAGTRSAFWQGGSVSAPAASMSATATVVTLGTLDGYVRSVCVDPSPTRCR